MNILIFNWRDKKHPFSGGAEIYIQEIAKRLARMGHKITLFCSRFGGLKSKDEYDGIKIIRRGGKYTVYLSAFFWYVFFNKEKYDVVIDCENGIPFFTPLFIRKPKILVVHHIHREIFPLEVPKIISLLLSFLETKLMPFLYKKIQVVAVSKSTKEDLIKIGFDERKIKIIYNGIDHSKFFLTPKTDKPRIIYIGRIKKYKRIDLLLKAFDIVSKYFPDAELYIVGSGKKKNCNNKIFTGFVSEEEKIRLLGSSWVFVNPSYKEGWGISIIEANMCGTPCIAFDVPGLRDSIKHKRTGILVKEDGNVQKLAEAIIMVLKDDKLRQRLSKNALEYSKKFSWDKTAKEFLDVINSIKNY